MTRRAISRRAFERAARKRFGITLRVVRELLRLFEKHTGKPASRKAFEAHPRIAARKVAPAKRRISREKRARVKATRAKRERAEVLTREELEARFEGEAEGPVIDFGEDDEVSP